MPAMASERAPANTASRQEPAAPPPMPREIQLARPATPLVAAMTMPTIRPASRTSRKTMSRLASMRLLLGRRLAGGDRAVGGVLVVLADDAVFPRLQRAGGDRDL